MHGAKLFNQYGLYLIKSAERHILYVGDVGGESTDFLFFRLYIKADLPECTYFFLTDLDLLKWKTKAMQYYFSPSQSYTDARQDKSTFCHKQL